MATIFLCVTEHGTGQKSNYVKMVAEVLQIHPDRISMTPADTLVTLSNLALLAQGEPTIGSVSLRRQKMRGDNSSNWLR